MHFISCFYKEMAEVDEKENVLSPNKNRVRFMVSEHTSIA